MKSRLILEANAWTTNERHVLDEGRVKAQRRRQSWLHPEIPETARGWLAVAGMEVAVNPLEPAINPVFADDVVDLRDGGQPASHTACACVRPNARSSSFKRRSVTIARCAVV